MTAAHAWDLHAGCAYCGAVGRDMGPDPSDPTELVCRACAALDATAPAPITIAGVVIPAREVERPEASLPSRARAVLDLVRVGGIDAWDVRREGREMDRAVARLVRKDLADAVRDLAAAVRSLPLTPSGVEVDDLARVVVETERRVNAALAWEQQRAEVRSQRRGA